MSACGNQGNANPDCFGPCVRNKHPADQPCAHVAIPPAPFAPTGTELDACRAAAEVVRRALVEDVEDLAHRLQNALEVMGGQTRMIFALAERLGIKVAFSNTIAALLSIENVFDELRAEVERYRSLPDVDGEKMERMANRANAMALALRQCAFEGLDYNGRLIPSERLVIALARAKEMTGDDEPKELIEVRLMRHRAETAEARLDEANQKLSLLGV